MKTRQLQTIVGGDKIVGSNAHAIISGSCAAHRANARDVCKIKMIVDRARIGSTLPKLIGVGVKTARPDFFQSEDIKRFVVSGWSCQ